MRFSPSSQGSATNGILACVGELSRREGQVGIVPKGITHIFSLMDTIVTNAKQEITSVAKSILATRHNYLGIGPSAAATPNAACAQSRRLPSPDPARAAHPQ